MPPSEKHLEFLQAAIARMASNSFMLKGWSVTVVAALLALAAGTGADGIARIALFPSVVFFLLDGYFLHLERRYRALYDSVRLDEPHTAFEMTLPALSFAAELASWAKALASRSVAWLHVTIIGVTTIVAFL